MGYYSERIKGSPLQKWRVRMVSYTAAAAVAMGVALYFSPGANRIRKLDEIGYFDPSPEQIIQREHLQMQLRGDGFININKDDAMQSRENFQKEKFQHGV